MHLSRRARMAATSAIALAAAALAPASASALQVTLTDDAGVPQAWSGVPALRSMTPTIGISKAAGEDVNYSATFAGPDGAGTSTAINCYGINVNRGQDYRGNGTYTTTITTYGPKDTTCKTPTGTTTFQYTVNAGVALGGPPAPRVLIRQPNSFVTQPVVLPFTPNPGSTRNEIRYGLNAVLGPDGGITSLSSEGFVDSATGTVPLRITTPGRYTAVARTGAISGAGPFYSPWSAPVSFDAVAPFDISSARTTDSRGPRYRIRVQLGEKTATGKVSIAIARGSKGGKYKSYGSAKIGRDGVFAKRFTLRKTGTYRMRFKYKGSATVAGGTIVSKFRVSKRFVF